MIDWTWQNRAAMALEQHGQVYKCCDRVMVVGETPSVSPWVAIGDALDDARVPFGYSYRVSDTAIMIVR